MKVTVLRPDELSSANVAAWRRIQQANPLLASPFLSPEFTIAVGRVRPQARVAVLEDGSDTVGFFPHEQAPSRIGRPIGAGVSDCHAIIHSQALDWEPRELLKGCGLAVWEFDHLLAEQPYFAPYHVVRGRSPIIDVSLGFDQYVRNRLSAGKTVRTTFKKAERLERGGYPVSFEFDVRDPDQLMTVIRWKSAQYRRTGVRDRFSWPWVSRLVEDLFCTRSEGCAGTLSMLYIDGQPAAGHFGLRSSTVLACWFPAYDRTFAKWSPGLILHLHMARDASDRGIQHLDLGKGMADYKDALASRDIPIAEGWVERRSAAAVLRRAQRLPGRYLARFIASHPGLRGQARGALRRFGAMRSAI